MVSEITLDIKEKTGMSGSKIGSKICPICKGFINKGTIACVDKSSFKMKQRGYDCRLRLRYYDERCLRMKLEDHLRKIYRKMLENGSYIDIERGIQNYKEKGAEDKYMKENYIQIVL